MNSIGKQIGKDPLLKLELEKELEIVLSDLEDMYLENIGYRKPNCK